MIIQNYILKMGIKKAKMSEVKNKMANLGNICDLFPDIADLNICILYKSEIIKYFLKFCSYNIIHIFYYSFQKYN